MGNRKPITGSIREPSPCKDCKIPHDITCHGTCEKFLAWRAKIDQANKARSKYYEKPFVPVKTYKE